MLESNNAFLIEFVWFGFSCVGLFTMSEALKQLSRATRGNSLMLETYIESHGFGIVVLHIIKCAPESLKAS